MIGTQPLYWWQLARGRESLKKKWLNAQILMRISLLQSGSVCVWGRRWRRRCAWSRSVAAPPGVIVGHKGGSHRDRGGVTQGKVVQAEHQALPGGTKCFTNVLKEKNTSMNNRWRRLGSVVSSIVQSLFHVLICSKGLKFDPICVETLERKGGLFEEKKNKRSARVMFWNNSSTGGERGQDRNWNRNRKGPSAWSGHRKSDVGGKAEEKQASSHEPQLLIHSKTCL